MLVYHFVRREHGLDNIRRHRLKIATIADVNDPLELLCLDLSDPAIRRLFLHWKGEVARRYGMICFSRRWDSTVQWGHYAESHRGLCLGFQIPDRFLTRVDYIRRRLVNEASAIAKAGRVDEATMTRVLSSKYAHWKYEREERLFVRLKDRDSASGLYFAKFSRNIKLVRVIVGANSTVTRQELQDALGPLAPKVRVDKARLAFRSFRVVRQRRASLWT